MRSLNMIIKIFVRSTTLHGFKYLRSPFCADRVGWTAWSVASACCAGVLCAVLWARFQQVPLLLNRRALDTPAATEQLAPLIAVCPSPYRAAQLLTIHLGITLNETKWLPFLFANILRGKPAADEHRELLDELLGEHNASLPDVLLGMSPCKELMRRCRWQNQIVPCNQLFGKKLTRWGACCVASAEKLLAMNNSAADFMETTQKLDLMMDCYVKRNYDFYCCELFIKYRGEEWLGPWYLMSGHSYTAQLVFTSVQDPVKDKIVNGTCVSATMYSQSRCMISCKETECGCSHPLRLKEEFETNLLPPCSVMRMKCLGNFIRGTSDDNDCNCLPACQRITAYMSVESIAINASAQSFNPIYDDVNSNSSIVLNIRIRILGSKSYDLMPTESWLTLLSSLGGVFNMFLGVGVFSILELLYFMFVRWPLTIKKPSDKASYWSSSINNNLRLYIITPRQQQ